MESGILNVGAQEVASLEATQEIDTLLSYCRTSEKNEIASQLRQVIDAFMVCGKNHFIPPYLRLLKVTLQCRSLYEPSAFPFLEAPLALAEFMAWDAMEEFKETALEIAEYTIAHRRESLWSRPSFFDMNLEFYRNFYSDTGGSFHGQSHLFPIKDVQDIAETLSVEEREEYLNLHKIYSKFGEGVLDVFYYYQDAQVYYPGGAKQMFIDLEHHKIPNPALFLTHFMGSIDECKDLFKLVQNLPQRLAQFYEFCRDSAARLGEETIYPILNALLGLFMEACAKGDEKPIERLKSAVDRAEFRLGEAAVESDDMRREALHFVDQFLWSYSNSDFEKDSDDLLPILETLYFGPSRDRSIRERRIGIFKALCRSGLDHRLAACLRPHGNTGTFDVVRHPQVSLNDNIEELLHFIARGVTCRKGKHGLYELEYLTVEESEFPDFIDQLRELQKRLEEKDLSWVMGRLPQWLSLIPMWKRLLTVEKEAGAPALVDSQLDLKPSPWLRSANATTQMAVRGEALRRVVTMDGVRRVLFDPVNPRLLTDGEDPREVLLLMRTVETEIRRALVEVIPEVELEIRTARRTVPGLLPVGMKCHTPEQMDAVEFEQWRELFGEGGLQSTPFGLIHGGKTLVMPPVPTPLEGRFLLGTFHTFRVLRDEDPGIQLALGGGRWTEERAAIVGSSILLSNHGGLEYAPGAFKSTHEVTESRIMVYDAGVKVGGLPYDLPVQGRTDMLEQVDGDSLDRYQVLGTLASHHQADGPLAPLWEEYVADYSRVLQHNGLYGALRSSTWVATGSSEADEVGRHEAMVGTFTKACNERPGLRREMRALIARTAQKIEALRTKIIRERPEEFERLLNY